MDAKSVEEAFWADVAVGYDRALRFFDAHIHPVVEKYGFKNVGVTNILMLLSIGFEKHRLVDIVRKGGYDGSNASYAITTLEAAGLVLRSVDSVDRRVRVVEATPMGRRLVEAIRGITKGDRLEVAAALHFAKQFNKDIVAKNGSPGSVSRETSTSSTSLSGVEDTSEVRIPSAAVIESVAMDTHGVGDKAMGVHLMEPSMGASDAMTSNAMTSSVMTANAIDSSAMEVGGIDASFAEGATS